MNGHRVFYAVDSRGEQIGLRTLELGASKRSVEAVIQGLWDELDRDDPIRSDASFDRAFRLIRGGLGAVFLAAQALFADSHFPLILAQLL